MKAKRILSFIIVLLLFLAPTTGAFANEGYVTLRFGSRGNEVVRLQQGLQNHGYYHSSIDGIYGQITERAVINFQRANGLIIDGIAGRQTQSRLYASTPANSVVTLRFGSRGSEVVRLQQGLQSRGYYNSSIDGIYGRITERAVINFQRDNGLVVDGIAGRQTQTSLYNRTTTASRGTSSSRSYTSDDLFWLARIIEAEAGGEPYNGKVAVGNVVLNRVNSSEFPNTIYAVIFDYHEHIPQFSPVAEGTIYNNPSQESMQAARDALNGARPVGNSTYFFNPDKAAGTWIVQNKTYVMRIGGHTFYR